jgi:hypothetical protein
MQQQDGRGAALGARGLAAAALLAALALTVGNAAKPLVIDDPVYVALARQILAHPGDPYGFELYWYDAPEPAMTVGTLPALLPYWLAGAMALFGDEPAAWKLSLFPFALALTGSLAFLLARFARPLAVPVLFTLALGPCVLPGFNLMLDVPAAALGLLGYALFVRACEREASALALAAGLVLGLALQTKYAAVTYPALAAIHAVIFRRLRLAAAAGVAAAALFVGWEGLLFARYGQSHFLAGLERLQTFENLAFLERAEAELPGTAAAWWTLGLISLAGGTAPFAGLLALAGLGVRPPLVSAAAGLAALGFALIPALPRPSNGVAGGFWGRLLQHNPELWLLVPLGLATFAGLFALARRGLSDPAPARAREDVLLAAWLLLEVAAYFVISPYPAVRRVIGLAIAAALLAARAVALRWEHPEARAGARVAVTFGLALALLFYASELADARTRRAFVAQIALRLSELGAPAARETVWFSGHWEVQFYGERAGWRIVIPERSRLRRGDWLVIPTSVDQPRIAYPPAVAQVDVLAAGSPSPWSTIPAYYSSIVPLRRRNEPQGMTRIYRVMDDMTPQAGGRPSGGG